MYSAYKLNNQGDNIQSWHTPFLILNQATSLEHFPNPGCYSPCSFPHLSHVAHLGTLNGAIKRWNSWAESWTAGDSRHSFTHTCFPHGRNFRPRWSLGTELCHLWRGIMVELNYSSYPFQYVLITDFCALCAETSLQDSCSSTELFLSKSMFFGKKM